MNIKFGKKYQLHIVGFKFMKRFVWVGFYWENTFHTHWCNIWVCLIPMLPFQLAWVYGEQGGYSDSPKKEN